ncbi:MAG: hypothetical protein ACPL8I_03695 [Chloroflexaceae bacterium]
MSKDIRNTIVVATGFMFGAWLYYLYQEGGWSLMLRDGWQGLLVALVFLAVVFLWDRVKKRS